ncbi:MAG: hypothetical protein IBX52_09180 [Bacterioplanes sp.]|nr:hypothetical protein [Bacterioplanes sp.]
MAKAEAEESLTEGQRLELLEKQMETNRLMMMVLAVLALIGLSVGLTMAVVKLFEPSVTYADSRDIKRIEADLAQVIEAANQFQLDAERYRELLDSSHATAFQRTLLEQERNYQLHLTALKDGMRDLARMVPGSRTWLDMYNEQMDTALRISRQRQERLEALQTNALPSPTAVPLPRIVN